MGINKFKKTVVFTLLALFSSSVLPAGEWGRVTQPARGTPEVIGGPAAGCLRGAVSLPPIGRGYQVMRLSRHRVYGHPSLVHFIEGLGEATLRKHLGVLLVGDLGQPRGGPTASLHRSHQNGLDVDLWYWSPEVANERPLNYGEIENLSARSMIQPDRRTINRALWGPVQAEVLRLAAEPEEVERIFVNPVIKKWLCEREGDREWLHKIRPWWGHDDHMHVRLYCPEGDERCTSQQEIPAGDGCGSDLDWWLDAVAAPSSPNKKAPPPPAPILPAGCASVLHAP
ncbi:Penicillin-insensitive murein endopeptidase [Gammaproteobacteria bacterium]